MNIALGDLKFLIISTGIFCDPIIILVNTGGYLCSNLFIYVATAQHFQKRYSRKSGLIRLLLLGDSAGGTSHCSTQNINDY